MSIPLLSPRRFPTAETIWINVARTSREKVFIAAILYDKMFVLVKKEDEKEVWVIYGEILFLANKRRSQDPINVGIK